MTVKMIITKEMQLISCCLHVLKNFVFGGIEINARNN